MNKAKWSKRILIDNNIAYFSSLIELVNGTVVFGYYYMDKSFFFCVFQELSCIIFQRGEDFQLDKEIKMHYF